MTNNLKPGQIIVGKVTGIQPYGAFIALDNETQGLVHISEITHGYVKDINEHLTVGEEVKVKVLSIENDNKVSLSIRATEEAPKKETPKIQPPKQQDEENIGFNTLKDKLAVWIEQSKERETAYKK